MGVIGLRGTERRCTWCQGLVSVLENTCPEVPAFVVLKRPWAVCAGKLAGKAVPVWDAMEGESPQLLLCLRSLARCCLGTQGFPVLGDEYTEVQEL